MCQVHQPIRVFKRSVLATCVQSFSLYFLPLFLYSASQMRYFWLKKCSLVPKLWLEGREKTRVSNRINNVIQSKIILLKKRRRKNTRNRATKNKYNAKHVVRLISIRLSIYSCVVRTYFLRLSRNIRCIGNSFLYNIS